MIVGWWILRLEINFLVDFEYYTSCLNKELTWKIRVGVAFWSEQVTELGFSQIFVSDFFSFPRQIDFLL